jgi:hypothetical protein
MLGPPDDSDATRPGIAEGIVPGRLRARRVRDEEPKPISEQTPDDVFGPPIASLVELGEEFGADLLGLGRVGASSTRSCRFPVSGSWPA